MNDFLLDFIQDLETSGRYRSIQVVHDEGHVYLDSLGRSGYEHFADLTDSLLVENDSVIWRMRTQLPCVELVEIELRFDLPLPEVRVINGQRVELHIDEVLGKLKEMYL